MNNKRSAKQRLKVSGRRGRRGAVGKSRRKNRVGGNLGGMTPGANSEEENLIHISPMRNLGSRF